MVYSLVDELFAERCEGYHVWGLLGSTANFRSRTM